VGQLDVAAAPSRERIDELIAQRVAAKKAMNYAEADRIRAEIDKLGAVPEDRPDGTSTWRWK
jgi:cysteinyl-tRNA synthetase